MCIYYMYTHMFFTEREREVKKIKFWHWILAFNSCVFILISSSRYPTSVLLSS